jgi:hypothetical protein
LACLGFTKRIATGVPGESVPAFSERDLHAALGSASILLDLEAAMRRLLTASRTSLRTAGSLAEQSADLVRLPFQPLDIGIQGVELGRPCIWRCTRRMKVLVMSAEVVANLAAENATNLRRGLFGGHGVDGMRADAIPSKISAPCANSISLAWSRRYPGRGSDCSPHCTAGSHYRFIRPSCHR